jgi:hypothetical protein
MVMLLLFVFWRLSLVFARFDFLSWLHLSFSKIRVRSKEDHPVSMVGPTVKDSNSEYASLFPTGRRRRRRRRIPQRGCDVSVFERFQVLDCFPPLFLLCQASVLMTSQQYLIMQIA